VHISELADHHVENPREVVNQGDELEVRIIEIDADRRRLSLSLKRVTPAPDGSTEGAVMSFGGDDDELADDIASEQVAEIEEAPAAVAAELELEAAEAITPGDEPVEAAEPVETEDATDPAEPAESED
jgi:small subunit ribosomal protein S1